MDHQRQRLLAGAAKALAEHGYAQMTVEHVLVNAGVSRTTFYENFANRRDCVLAAHGMALDDLAAELTAACAQEEQWPAKVAAALRAAIRFATRVPEEAQLLVLDALAADPTLAARAVASNEYLIGLLRNGREESPGAPELPELTERALIGAIVSVVGARLMGGQADRLEELEPQLIQLVLMPYVGIEEAARWASGPR